MNQGRTVFAELVELLPRKAFDLAVRRYNGNRRVRSLSCMDQLLCMIFAQLTARSSLRETVTCLQAMGARRYCDFARLYRLHTMGAFFITRAKRTMNFGVGQRLAVPRGGSISSDWLI